MRDTADVLSRLDVDQTDSKLLAIVANKRGALEACSFDQITYLGYPFSVSETFQQRNTNRSIESSLLLVEELQNVCLRKNKTLVVYLSMAFGNPYGEVWDLDMIAKWTHFLTQMGVKVIALSDTIGISSKATVTALFSQLIPEFSEVTFGAHLHTTAQNWKENVLAAYQAGCTRFDSAIKGYGGCPMAKDELTGNMPTEKLLSFFNEQKEDAGLNAMAFESAYNKALEIFR
jgi:hydroxymethylglutaryl-CoA lyase